MKVLIYSDVHGNLPAFKSILKDAGKCDSYLCLGDLVNYGPWSNECIDLALTLPNSIILRGNHEEAFIDGTYKSSNVLVNEFFTHTIKDFNRFELIESFLPSYQLEDYLCIHTIFDKNIYPDTQLEIDRNYIIGHSHHQFHIKYNEYNLYNAGSVGQNRKYINVANYLIFDTEINEIEMRYAKFDVNQIINEMKKNNYPKNCISYYTQKQQL